MISSISIHWHTGWLGNEVLRQKLLTTPFKKIKVKGRESSGHFTQLHVHLTLPPLSIDSCTFFRKSLSLHLFESRIVVAYVDSEMRMSGRHLSIHAALKYNTNGSWKSWIHSQIKNINNNNNDNDIKPTLNVCQVSYYSLPKRNTDIIVGHLEWKHLTSTQERLVYTHSVDDRLWSHFDVHHGSSEDVTCIVRLDLQLIIHLPTAQRKEKSWWANQEGRAAAADYTRRISAPEQSGGGSGAPLSSCNPWSSGRWRSWSLPSCRPWFCGSLPAEWGRWPWWDGSCKLAHHSPPSHSWRAKRHSGPSGNGWGRNKCSRSTHWESLVEYRGMPAILLNTNLMITQSRKSVRRPFWVI